MGDKYGIDPPKGSVRLRHEISRSQDVINLDGSVESISSASEADDSLNASTQSLGSLPRKQTSSSFNSAGSPSPHVNRRRPIISHSPSTKIKIHHDVSDIDLKSDKDDSEKESQVEMKRYQQLSSDNISTMTEGRLAEKTSYNPRLATVMAIVEKVGMNSSDFIRGSGSSNSAEQLTKKDDLFVLSDRAMMLTRKQQHENEINITVREIFVNRFTQMLVDYEQFVILPKQSKDDWLNNREQMQNFDKASFLSDQSQSNLPFMTLFVETQGFASLIDMKIMALWEDCDPRLAYFDKRIDKLKIKLGIIRSSAYEICNTITSSGKINFYATTAV